MKKSVVASTALVCLFFVGCDSLRFAPSEVQKQNAWVHNRTAAIAVQAADDEIASQKLQSLTKLSEQQSRAFVAYHGLPKEFPVAETAEDVLGQSNFQLANSALSDSTDRPDTFEVADSVFELLIGIAALAGGIYGTRSLRFLKDARVKSRALKEIVDGNELFKQRNPEQATGFKEAHRNQSSGTKQIVTSLKG
ncbi:MAG: hypothetical protein ACYSWP_02140 [Planctomycetota bacterium]|jgi:hypothetical protein